MRVLIRHVKNEFEGTKNHQLLIQQTENELNPFSWITLTY